MTTRYGFDAYEDHELITEKDEVKALLVDMEEFPFSHTQENMDDARERFSELECEMMARNTKLFLKARRTRTEES